MNPARERGELLLAPDGWPGLRASALPLFPEVADDDAIVPLLELATVTTGDRESGRRCPARWWCSRWHSRRERTRTGRGSPDSGLSAQNAPHSSEVPPCGGSPGAGDGFFTLVACRGAQGRSGGGFQGRFGGMVVPMALPTRLEPAPTNSLSLAEVGSLLVI